MARVLLGWELGGGLGHVAALLPVARKLAAQGHEPVFAVKNLPASLPVLRDQGFRVLQAPVWPIGAGTGWFQANSFADILSIRGFEHADELEMQVNAWQGLLDLTDAKLVVSDYSPTLNLAAYGKVPVVLLGNGFTLPPSETSSFSPLDVNGKVLVPQEKLLANIQEVQRRRGRQIPEHITAIFGGAGTFIYSFPELDPYRKVRRQHAFVGPYHAFPRPSPPPREPLAFVYLSMEFPGAVGVLTGLSEAGIGGHAFYRDATPASLAALRVPRFQVYDAPPEPERLLSATTLLIHHAGAGLAASALAAGRPQVCLPRYLEQELTGRTVADLGVGVNLTGNVAMNAFIDSVRWVMSEKSFSQKALTLAHDLEARGPWRGLAGIVDRCLELLK